MNRSAKPHLSRLWAFCTILCMVAVFGAGLSSVQSSLSNLQHHIGGDTPQADGGWSSPCNGQAGGCSGHTDAPHVHEDGEAPDLHHHHHHFSESPTGILSDGKVMATPLMLAHIHLRPGEDHNLAGRFSASIDQPPRL